MDHVGNIRLLGGGQFKNARLENLAVDPATPFVGQIWFNTVTGLYHGYDGTNVTTFASGGNAEAVLARLNAVITSTGLSQVDGSLPSLAATNYIAEAPTIFAALVALDTQAKTGADAQTATDLVVTGQGTQIATMIAALGLGAEGAFVPYTGANYVAGATSEHGAVTALDTQAKVNADAVAANTTSIAGKVSLAGDAMSGNLTFSGLATVTGLKAPENVSDAATRGYVDALVNGLSWLRPTLAALPSHLDFATALVIGDRIANLTDFKIYTVTAGGANGAGATFDAGVAVAKGEAFLSKDTAQGYTFNGVELVGFTSAGAAVAGIGLTQNGTQIDVNMGAGIAQLPTDEVGIDVSPTGGLFLTVDGTTPSTDTAAQLHLLLDGGQLVTSATGLKLGLAGVTENELAASVAGAGLIGGAGAALSVATGNGLKLNGDAVELDQAITDALYVALAGGTLTGPLLTAADPAVPLEVANKRYVDLVKAAVEGGTFVYTGAVAATSHEVIHNIGSKFVGVTVIDGADNVIIPDTVVFNDTTKLTVTFSSAITCKIVATGKFVPAVV